MKKIRIAFLIWIILYNIAFFAYVVYYQRPVDTIIGVYPSSTFWYIIMLSVIAVGNWILGWKIINAPNEGQPSKIQKEV